MLKMNLDNLLIEQEYIDKFSQEIYAAKALADTDKSQRAAFISILIHALNNRPESDALFFSRIDLTKKNIPAGYVMVAGWRPANGLSDGATHPMISLVIMWMSLIRPCQPR